MIVAFCSANCDPDEVTAGLAEAACGVPVIGCSSQAVMTPAGVIDRGVAAMACGGPGLSAATAFSRVPDGTARSAGADVASCFRDVTHRRYKTLLLLTDGLVREQEEILSGVYSVVGASVPLVGGSSSADRRNGTTFQIHGTNVMTGGVIGAMIGSDAPLGIGHRHGWRRVGQPMIVTHSERGVVKTLNDESALAMYLRGWDAPLEAYESSEAFQGFAATRPIGVARRSGEDLRDVSSSEYFEQGWLYSTAEIPEGGLVWRMESDSSSVLDAAWDAGCDARVTLGESPPLGMIVFDCVFRGGMLGDEGIQREVESLIRFGVPLIGTFTLGEIARVQGINAYHNLTAAVLAMG